jgi:hypothetical protein
MNKETPSLKAARFRKMADDKSLPQDVRNAYLDKANEVEKEESKPTMNKGGMAMQYAKGGMAMKYAKGGMAMPSTSKPTTKDSMKPTSKAPMKAPMKGAKAPVAVMISFGKPKEKMAKGGMVKPKK